MQFNPNAAAGLLLLLPLSVNLEAQEMEYRSNPGQVEARGSGVGRWVPDVSFTDSTGTESSLAARMGKNGLVIAMRDPDCPLSKRYGPRSSRLEKEAEQLGFGILFVEVVEDEDGLRDAKSYGFQSALAMDSKLELAAALGAKTTTEVFVLDPARTIRYRGMLDDQYGLGFSRPKAQNTYLSNAMQEVASGKDVSIPATMAQGCLLDISEVELPQPAITYHNRISRIVQNNCMNCHREGEAAPFALGDFESVKRRKRMIKFALTDGVMPPWFASEESGPFSNDMSLPPDELADFLTWIDGESLEGDIKNAPAPKEWVQGWTIGQPDLVVEMPETFEVPAEGEVDYEYFYTQTNLEQDTWIQALEILPGTPEVVHHVLVFIESPELYKRARSGDRTAARAIETGGETYFACMVPGQTGLVFPDGMAKLLPAGSWLKFQLHYTPSGKVLSDKSRIGLVFAKDQKHDFVEVQTNCASNESFGIPAGAYAYEVSARYRFKDAGTLLSLFPHTHLRGMRFLMELEYPDGRREDLLDVPFYDFNWQLNYEFKTPVEIPKGTFLHATGWYDNSEDNPSNPDPSRIVRIGEQTSDEMMIGYFNWVKTDDLKR